MPKAIPENEGMEGFPEDGDIHPESPGSDPAPAPAPAPAPQSDVAALQAQLAETQRRLDDVSQRIPPAQPKQPIPGDNDPLAGVDVDKELFSNPRKFLGEFAQKIEGRVTRQLETRYQQDRGTQRFWEDFYTKHGDLKQDHDLVDITLKGNLNEMSNMPVDKAMDRLAELTRDRILRYAGGARKTPKARAEGGGPPSEPRPQPQKAEVTSISDLIRARKAARRAVGT